MEAAKSSFLDALKRGIPTAIKPRGVNKGLSGTATKKELFCAASLIRQCLQFEYKNVSNI